MRDWPRLPIHPEDLPKIRELLTTEEYEKLLKRLEPPAPPQYTFHGRPC